MFLVGVSVPWRRVFEIALLATISSRVFQTFIFVANIFPYYEDIQ